MNTFNYYKCDGSDSRYCFIPSKGLHSRPANNIKYRLQPKSEVLYLVPLDNISFYYDHLLSLYEISRIPFYSCFFPYTGNEMDLISPKPKCNACYKREKGIFIGSKISVNEIIRGDFKRTRFDEVIPCCNIVEDKIVSDNILRFELQLNANKFINYPAWLVNNTDENFSEYLKTMNNIYRNRQYVFQFDSEMDLIYNRRRQRFDSIFFDRMLQ